MCHMHTCPCTPHMRTYAHMDMHIHTYTGACGGCEDGPAIICIHVHVHHMYIHTYTGACGGCEDGSAADQAWRRCERPRCQRPCACPPGRWCGAAGHGTVYPVPCTHLRLSTRPLVRGCRTWYRVPCTLYPPAPVHQAVGAGLQDMVRVCVHMRAHARTRRYTHACICMRVCMHTYMYIRAHVHTCTCTCMHTCTCTYRYAYMHMYVQVCIHVHTHAHVRAGRAAPREGG